MFNKNNLTKIPLTLLMTILLVPHAFAQISSSNYSIPTLVMDGGGGKIGSTSFEARNSIGQPSPIGILESQSFCLYAGFQPTTLEEFSPRPLKRGDVNGDRAINILDVLAVVNHILGILPLTGDALDRADCNGDGVVNILDVVGIVNVILGILPECPGQGDSMAVYPETTDFLNALKPYLSPQDFASFIAMVKQVGVPTQFELGQNYPNPFNPTTAINYQIPMTKSQIHTTLKIFNILGQEVATLVDEVKEPGYYTVTWDASDMASGVYFYRLTVGDGEWSQTRRMVLVK